VSSKPGKPAVSVIVPAYNSARTIGRCMASLAAQRTAHEFEVVLVHSGDDDTAAVARRALPAVRIVELASRAIPPRARNVGVREARGAVLAFLDSDAYAAEDWIDHLVRAAGRSYDLVCGSIGNANEGSAVSRAEQLIMFNEFLPDARERASWFALSGNMLLRREAFDRFGPFAEVRAAEDVVFSRLLIAKGGRILFYPALRAFHDNRTRVRPYLRNQVLVGKHTAIARRRVRFADSGSYLLLLLALPVAPAVKLAKIAAHLWRDHPRNLVRLTRELPLVCLGVLAYSIGLVLGALARLPEAEPAVPVPAPAAVEETPRLRDVSGGTPR
jgi:glycosyltransferase involved in cell wall biosynthesis